MHLSGHIGKKIHVKNTLILLTMTLVALTVPKMSIAQNGVFMLKGRVICEGKGVPYASLNLMGTSICVLCNDAGHYELKLPDGHESDTVLIRSMGYRNEKRVVRDLMKRGDVRLKVNPITLHEVKVTSVRSAKQLIMMAVNRIDDNYQTRTAYSTFFYRDWRSLDGELYLLDEAVMCVQRAGYGSFPTKMGYAYNNNVREMDTDYKTLLKHRLVVIDYAMLEEAVQKQRGIDEMVEYADNAVFFDPVSTPQANYMLAKRVLGKHKYNLIMEFEDNDEPYYLVRSVGPGRIPKARVNYEYIIRKSDLAIVRISSSENDVTQRAPTEAWVNGYFTHLTVDADTSAWTYEVRDGRYTLTHYYNSKSFLLSSRGRNHDGETQRWQRCVDWTLTDFSLSKPAHAGKAIEVRPQTLSQAFGQSDDITSSYWEQYNSILIDELPLRMLKEKLEKNKEKQP